MSGKGFNWFVGEFLPSLEKRMNNPKYPNTCILTEAQEDVCVRYMKAIQTFDCSYNMPNCSYALVVGNRRYTLTRRGRYAFLSLRDLEWEKNYFEAKRRADLITTLVKQVGYSREDLETKTTEEIDEIIDREFDV